MLMMDVWEHAYIKDYAPADRPKYIEAFFSNIDWDTVSGRLSRARGLLRDRLVRRGLAPTEGSLGMLLAVDGVRAAVPEPLTAATARAAW